MYVLNIFNNYIIVIYIFEGFWYIKCNLVGCVDSDVECKGVY